jgi:hypothetical protein
MVEYDSHRPFASIMIYPGSRQVPLAPSRCGTAQRPSRTSTRPWLPSFSPSSSLALLLILILGLVGASRAQLDPVRNFCRRFGHQTAVIDRRLYIDGGFINYNPIDQYPTNYTSRCFFTASLFFMASLPWNE